MKVLAKIHDEEGYLLWPVVEDPAFIDALKKAGDETVYIAKYDVVIPLCSPFYIDFGLWEALGLPPVNMKGMTLIEIDSRVIRRRKTKNESRNMGM